MPPVPPDAPPRKGGSPWWLTLGIVLFGIAGVAAAAFFLAFDGDVHKLPGLALKDATPSVVIETPTAGNIAGSTPVAGGAGSARPLRLVDALLFVSDRDGAGLTNIWRVSEKGGKAERITREETNMPAEDKSHARNVHSAIFAEVKVDEEIGIIRVTRVVKAVAAGRILNLKTAHSQIMGGVVWGIGMALHEETLYDHLFGRVMNANIAEYHVPVNADIHDINVIFVDEPDEKVNPLGIKGLGEIGIVGVAAAVANAVYHATGKRVRDLPITLDKVIQFN